MYSPKIYESQIPCLYHAAQNLEVPMTQLANAFVYYGLISGYYGQAASELLPQPNQVLPEGVFPRMKIFSPQYNSIRDYMMELPMVDTLNLYFQTISDLRAAEHKKSARADAGAKEYEIIPV
jgi:hypothetical protein